jgi:PAS domain S-box-containing protein
LPGTPPPEAAKTGAPARPRRGGPPERARTAVQFAAGQRQRGALGIRLGNPPGAVRQPAYERIFGRPVSLLLADYNEWRDSIYPDDLEYAERSLAQVLLKGAVEDREYRILNADGQLRWLSDKCYINQQHVGDRVIIVGIAEDITEKKQLEGELQRLATTDVLTQSSNRRHFFECAQQAFDSAREDGTPLAFLLLDIDDFKRINDSYGHQEGDQVLQRIADSGKAVLRRGDLFGRIGGEEFAAVFPVAIRRWPSRLPNACSGRSSG